MQKKGISLIVLSITILVMAILAATAIIALEDTGIIGRSKNTVSKQNYTEEYTRLQVIKNGILTDNLGTITVDEYITELTNKGLIESEVTTNSDGSKTVTTKAGFVANIAQDGNSNLIISLAETTEDATDSQSVVQIVSAEVTPTSISPRVETTIYLTATVNKSKADEELVYTYKFYEYTSDANAAIYPVEGIFHEYVISTTSENVDTSTNITAQYDVCWYLVELEVTDVYGNQKATSTFVYGNNGAYDYTIYATCLPAGTLITVEVEEEDENGKKRKRRKKKRIEDITYDDDLVVWDFDNGCFTTAKPLWLTVRGEAEEYNLLKFSDGSELKTVRQHRIFNKELGKFTYPMTDETPIGTTTFNELGEEVTLVSKEVVCEKVSYYNVISHYHMNAFAEGILTSCRFSNLYEIKDMKYVKDDRELVSIEEYKDIPEEYFYGLRVAEQPKEVNRGNDDSHAASIKDHIKMYISRSKKR